MLTQLQKYKLWSFKYCHQDTLKAKNEFVLLCLKRDLHYHSLSYQLTLT